MTKQDYVKAQEDLRKTQAANEQVGRELVDIVRVVLRDAPQTVRDQMEGVFNAAIETHGYNVKEWDGRSLALIVTALGTLLDLLQLAVPLLTVLSITKIENER